MNWVVQYEVQGMIYILIPLHGVHFVSTFYWCGEPNLHPLMSLLIRYAHIPFYFRFSFTFPTSPIHPYAPPLRRDRTRARTTIALTLSDRSCLFDGHMTYNSHVFTSILSVSNVPPPAVRPIMSSRTAQSGTFISFAICSHSCLPFVFNLAVFTFHKRTSSPKP